MAMTQCPACSKAVEHKRDFAITVIRRIVDDGMRTVLIANDTLAVHACLSTPAYAHVRALKQPTPRGFDSERVTGEEPQRP